MAAAAPPAASLARRGSKALDHFVALVEEDPSHPIMLRGVELLCARWDFASPAAHGMLLQFPCRPGISVPFLPSQDFLERALRDPGVLQRASAHELAQATPDVRRLAVRQLARLRSGLPAVSRCAQAEQRRLCEHLDRFLPEALAVELLTSGEIGADRAGSGQPGGSAAVRGTIWGSSQATAELGRSVLTALGLAASLAERPGAEAPAVAPCWQLALPEGVLRQADGQEAPDVALLDTQCVALRLMPREPPAEEEDAPKPPAMFHARALDTGWQVFKVESAQSRRLSLGAGLVVNRPTRPLTRSPRRARRSAGDLEESWGAWSPSSIGSTASSGLHRKRRDSTPWRSFSLSVAQSREAIGGEDNLSPNRPAPQAARQLLANEKLRGAHLREQLRQLQAAGSPGGAQEPEGNLEALNARSKVAEACAQLAALALECRGVAAASSPLLRIGVGLPVPSASSRLAAKLVAFQREKEPELRRVAALPRAAEPRPGPVRLAELEEAAASVVAECNEIRFRVDGLVREAEEEQQVEKLLSEQRTACTAARGALDVAAFAPRAESSSSWIGQPNGSGFPGAGAGGLHAGGARDGRLEESVEEAQLLAEEAEVASLRLRLAEIESASGYAAEVAFEASEVEVSVLSSAHTHTPGVGSPCDTFSEREAAMGMALFQEGPSGSLEPPRYAPSSEPRRGSTAAAHSTQVARSAERTVQRRPVSQVAASHRPRSRPAPALRGTRGLDELRAAREAMEQALLGRGPHAQDPRAGGAAGASRHASQLWGDPGGDFVSRQQRWRCAPVPAGSCAEEEEPSPSKQGHVDALSRCLHASVRLANERGRAESAFAALKRARAKLAVTESWLASAAASEHCG